MPSPSFWRNRRIVVTGGTGFLGRRLVGQLHEMGAEASSLSRRQGCDLRDRQQAEHALADLRPEVVFHLAADQGGVAYQRVCPATILHDNILITVNTMEAARLAGAQLYVNIIAACAYPAAPQGVAFREDEFEGGPMHESADNYGMSKRVAVMQAKHYRRQYGFNVASVALANCYGPGDHFSTDRSHALAALLRRFYEAQRDHLPEVTVWGRGIAERDLLYVDDAVAGILLALEHCPDIDLLNIGTGRGCSIAELAELIRTAVGYSGTIAFDAARPEGPLKKTLDVSRMKSLLRWSPPTPLAEGIQRTYTWLVEHYQEATQDG